MVEVFGVSGERRFDKEDKKILQCGRKNQPGAVKKK